MSQLEQAVAAIAQQTVANMLPQIVAAVQGQMGTQGVAVGAGTNLAAAQVAQPAPDPFGGLGAATVQPTVTPQMVQELITPYLANEQHKQAFIAQMQALGITNIGDTPADQLPALYARFQQVVAQITGGAVQQAAATGGAPSII
jgi:hypothetical protein